MCSTKLTVSQKRLSQCAFKEVCFREPSRQFCLRPPKTSGEMFKIAQRIGLDLSEIFQIFQRDGESVNSYLTRFRNVLDQIDSIPEEIITMCFQRGLLPGTLKTEFSLRPPKRSGEMFKMARRIGNLEEFAGEKGDKSKDSRESYKSKDDWSGGCRRGKGKGKFQVKAETFTPPKCNSGAHHERAHGRKQVADSSPHARDSLCP